MRLPSSSSGRRPSLHYKAWKMPPTRHGFQSYCSFTRSDLAATAAMQPHLCGMRTFALAATHGVTQAASAEVGQGKKACSAWLLVTRTGPSGGVPGHQP
jgi:hypothetical protein